jgi:adenylate cyclase
MERRLTAILAADVVDYSRLMGLDETGTLSAFSALKSGLIDPAIARHGGRTFKLTGDGMLVEFASVVSAVACAVEIQRQLKKRNESLATDRRLEFRIGVNIGDVIVEGEDIFGDGVNLAARLEGVAPPGGIAISRSAREQVGQRLNLTFEDMGEQRLKNIEKPVRVYHVSLEETAVAAEAPAARERPSIAVLPFNNMSGDPEQEYFSDGITEDLITELSKVSGLFVVARHGAFTYKARPMKVQQIGRELGVASILEGSVRKAGSRVRVTAQLINSRDGGHLWADRFDRELTDIFAIQDEITHAIVEQLKVKLLPHEQESIEQAPTGNVEAYTYYLRGRQFLLRGHKGYYQLARRMFAKAVELDPLYARAYAGIANCDAFISLQTRSEVAIESILGMSAKAIELDDKLAEAHASLGLALALAKRYGEAIKEFEKAIALDPNSFEANYFYGRAAFAEGEEEKAAALFQRAAEMKPDDYQTLCLLGSIYKALGREEDSRRAAKEGLKRAERQLALEPANPRPAYLGASCLLTIGDRERAHDWTVRALAIDPDDILVQYNVACIYSRLGKTEDAIELLEGSLPRTGHEWARWIRHDSDLDPLRNDPRFQHLIDLTTSR